MIPKMKPMTDPRATAGAESAEILPARHQLPELGRDRPDLVGLLQVQEDLGKAEQADRQSRKRQTAGEVGAAEGEARRAGELVEADGAERETERNHGGGLDPRASGHHRYHGEREQDQHHLHRWADRDHHLGERRHDEHKTEDRDGAPDEAAERSDHQGRAGTTLAGHLIAIDAGNDRRRLAGDAHQDRRGRAAVHGTVENTGQHDDADGRIEAEGQRQQERDARERPDARQHADNGSPETAEEAI